MHFSSTLNPLSKSNGDVPIGIISYEGKRKFVLKTETFEDMIELVRGYFNIAQDSAFIKLETSTLDVCQGRSIEVDASAWVHMWRVLDEISVVVAPDNRTLVLIEANAQATTAPSAPATLPSIPTAVVSPKQGRHIPPVTGGGALTTTSPSIPTTILPPNQEQPTLPLAGGSALTTLPSLPVNGLPLERANKTPPTVLRDKRNNNESAMDELREDSATDGQATDAPSWFILSSPPGEVKPKANLAKKLNTTTTADGSTWERKKARAQATSPVEQNDVFTSTKGTEIGTNEVGNLPTERFSISIRGPDGRSLDFRLKKSHTVQKVLFTACKYFKVDFNRGFLCQDGDDYALNNSDTVMQAGLRDGSNVVLYVNDQLESESGEE